MGSELDRFLEDNRAEAKDTILSVDIADERPSFMREGLKRGLARGIGRVGDTPAAAYQVTKAALNQPYAWAAAKVTGKPQSEFLSEPDIGATTMFHDYLVRAFANPEMKPQRASERVALGVGEALGESAYPSGLVKAPAKAAARQLIKAAAQDTGANLAIGGAAGLGATGAGELSDGNPYAQIIGGIIGPAAFVALSPTIVAKRLIAAMRAGKQTAEGQAPKVASKYITDKIIDAAAGNPYAGQNAQEAQRIAAQMGRQWNPSIGEITGTPALLDMESKFAATSPKTLNREAARRSANESAITERYQQIVPESTGQDLSGKVTNALVGEQAAIDASLSKTSAAIPTSSQADVGQDILSAAKKTKADVQTNVITPAYEKAFEIAGDAKMSIDGIIKEAETVLGETLSKVKPDVAPNTIAAIKRLQVPQPKGITILGPDGKPLSTVGNVATTDATLRDVDALHKAVNADVSAARSATDYGAAMRARNLMRLHDSIDEAIAASKIPQAAKYAYSDAVEKWKTEFKPRFKEGVNADLLRGSRRNEPSAIRLDEITSRYFRAGGEVEAKQFTNLAKNDPTMVDGLKRGIMDLYRAEVVNPQSGVLDITKHNAFMHRYEKPLGVLAQYGIRKELAEIGSTLRNIAARQENLNTVAKRIGYDSTDELVSSVIANRKDAFQVASVLGPAEKKDLTRAVMDRVWDSGQNAQGLNSDGLNRFIAQNRNGLLDALTASEGRQSATVHLASLEDIGKAADIATRGKALGGIAGATDDPLRQATGVSLSTVMSQARGIQMGRTSVPVAASMMAGPIMRKIGMERFDELMYGALHSKEMASDLAMLLKARTEQQAEGLGKRLIASWKKSKPAVMAGMRAFAYTATGAGGMKGNMQRAIPPTIDVMQDSLTQQ